MAEVGRLMLPLCSIQAFSPRWCEMRQKCQWILCCVASLFLSPLTSFALGQVGRTSSGSTEAIGAIRGVIRDSSGGALAGTEVQLVSAGTVVIADAQGRYLLRAVPTGDQRIIARRVGYRPEAVDVTLGAGMTADVD